MHVNVRIRALGLVVKMQMNEMRRYGGTLCIFRRHAWYLVTYRP